MIVEFAGLPGAGKTTICNLVSEPHGGKGAVPLTALRPSFEILRAGWNILALALTTRPFRFERLKRTFNLIVFLRHYEHRGLVILLDQGIVQKIWSILADANYHSSERRRQVMASLLPFAPDWVVWLETPLDAATSRLVARADGNSRYDSLAPDEALKQLAERRALLRSVVEEFCKTVDASLLEIDGTLPAGSNAARIDALLRGHHSLLQAAPNRYQFD